jgi:hypothetical protein
MKITTNKIPRGILYFHDLNQKQQEEVLSTYPDAEDNQYFSFKKDIYCLTDFLRFEHHYFHGIHAIMWGYAIAVRIENSGQIIVGTITQ